MEKNTIYVIVGICLFLLVWFILTNIAVNLNISRDEHFVKTINERAFNENNAGELGNAVVTYLDAQLKYEQRVWKLQNPVMYWMEGALIGFLVTLLVAIIINCVIALTVIILD